jgi:glycosyltransferase 2 family protein
MRFAPVIAALLGLAVGGGLIAHFGAGAVAATLFSVGLFGFAAICLIHLGLIAVMGLAWRALLPGIPAGAAIWGRLVRDSASEVLPLSQVGGYVLGVRAIALAGVGATAATASTIVDVTLEFLAQLAYTAIALTWLLHLRPAEPAAIPVGIALGGAVAVAAAAVFVQRRGFDVFGRLARAPGRGWAAKSAAGAAALHAAIAGMYRRRGGVRASFALHLGCWLASAVEVWLALRFVGSPLPFGVVLVIESLLYAARSLAFFVPNAVGVQEGAYILLGGSFGLTPDVALALSLLKRARDLAIGLPALGAWQLVESGRWSRRLAARRAQLP